MGKDRSRSGTFISWSTEMLHVIHMQADGLLFSDSMDKYILGKKLLDQCTQHMYSSSIDQADFLEIHNRKCTSCRNIVGDACRVGKRRCNVGFLSPVLCDVYMYCITFLMKLRK